METEAPKRPRGRPPLPEDARRSESITASVTSLERDALRAKAKELGKPLATMIRDAVLALLLGALVFVAPGCGSAPHAARDTQIVAISVTGSVLSMVGQEIGDLARAQADRDCGTVSTPESDACIAGVLAQWAPADAALDTAHAALDAWLGGLDSDPVHAVEATIEAYEAMARALNLLGVKVPPIPNEVKAALLALASAGGEVIRAVTPDAGT